MLSTKYRFISCPRRQSINQNVANEWGTHRPKCGECMM